MVKTTKGFKLLVTAVFLMACMTVTAFAASTDTSSIKDDFYFAQTEPDEQETYYKLSVMFTDGKVDTDVFKFNSYAGTQEFTESFLNYVPEEQKATLKAMLDEIAYYSEQMISVGDAMKITKYPDAANNEMHTIFQTLWKDIIAQAGGKIVTDAGSTPVDNPKTGDNGIGIYVALVATALVGFAVLRKKKLSA